MSIEATSWVFEHSRSKGAARLVLLSIANHADPFGKSTYPSLGTISRESGVSLRQIKRSFAQLLKIGELRIQRCASPFGTNVYALPLFHSLQGEGGDTLSPGVTGCAINKNKREEPPDTMWKTQPIIGPMRVCDWLKPQIDRLAKAKAL